MASTIDFLNYALDQLDGVGRVTYRRMFAEYCIYVDGKPLILIINSQIFLKKLPELTEIMTSVETGIPYPRLHERYIIDVDDRELLQRAVLIAKNSNFVLVSKYSQPA